VLRAAFSPDSLPAWFGSVGGQRSPHDPALPAALARAHPHGAWLEWLDG
jgi:hypothetical protein